MANYCIWNTADFSKKLFILLVFNRKRKKGKLSHRWCKNVTVYILPPLVFVFLYFIIYFYFTCIGVLLACMWHPGAVPAEDGREIWSFRCELSCMCWERNPGPLPEQALLPMSDFSCLFILSRREKRRKGEKGKGFLGGGAYTSAPW